MGYLVVVVLVVIAFALIMAGLNGSPSKLWRTVIGG